MEGAAEQGKELEELVPKELRPFMYGQRVVLLDEEAEAAKGASLDLRKAGCLRAGLALRFEQDPARVAQALAALQELEVTPALQEAYVAWIRLQMIDWNGSEETIGWLNTLKEATKVYTNHISKVAQAAEARGLREAYVETAKWKFGADAAERLADVLSGVTDRSRLERLGQLLAECETADELIAKARGD